jgi:hypothetical protein
MRFKIKALVPAAALLAGLILAPLPAAQAQSENAIQAGIPAKNSRCINHASRSSARVPFASPAFNKRYASCRMQEKYKWGSKEYGCLVTMWSRESGWRVDAHNRSSGAHGIPQSLPGNKMASAGPNWYTNPFTQVDWGLKYIKSRYGTPCNAWGFWQSHHWY